MITLPPRIGRVLCTPADMARLVADGDQFQSLHCLQDQPENHEQLSLDESFAVWIEPDCRAGGVNLGYASGATDRLVAIAYVNEIDHQG